MTPKFTHPDEAEPGHEWVSDAGRPAKHLGGDWWAHLTKNRATAFAFGGVIARVRVPFSWTEGQFDE